LATISAVLAGAALGLLAGVGGYTFVYAKGVSYLADNPAACANCHIMREHYSGWSKSSHHSVATCNDCHTPPSFVAKYLTKGENGFWHSFAFTTGRFSDPLRIRPRNLRVTELACRKCHADIVGQIEGPPHGGAVWSCTRCHDSVGHLQ
jgi:cytochrome c nitrite reductase small subunit